MFYKSIDKNIGKPIMHQASNIFIETTVQILKFDAYISSHRSCINIIYWALYLVLRIIFFTSQDSIIKRNRIHNICNINNIVFVCVRGNKSFISNELTVQYNIAKTPKLLNDHYNFPTQPTMLGDSTVLLLQPPLQSTIQLHNFLLQRINLCTPEHNHFNKLPPHLTCFFFPFKNFHVSAFLDSIHHFSL